MYHLPPFFTSNPFLITPPSVAPRLPEASFAEASQHPPSLKKNTPVPACQPSSGWKPSGLLWGMGEFTPPPCVSFPSIPPQGHGASLPPPSQFLPVSQARSIQDTQLPGVRVPHSSGFTPPQGGLQIPSWGVGAGQGRLELKVHRGPIRPTGLDVQDATPWASGAPRTPSTVEKDKISNLCG